MLIADLAGAERAVSVALEPHFWERLLEELGVEGDRRDLQRIFGTRTAERWEEWAAERHLPLAAVRLAERDDEANETASAPQRKRPSRRGEGRA